MSKNVLVISTSLRKSGNSDKLADAFVEGALSAGHHAEKLNLQGKDIAFCRGCLACQKTHQCVIADDAIGIAEKMRTADVIAFATPIYYYEMSGQMKTLLDRANSLYGSDYTFREIYLLSAAAEDEPGVDSRAISGLEGWIACFEKAHLAGTVFCGGVNQVCDIQGRAALEEARSMGASIG